jgi:pyridoxal phosphate enzyme (YggS family)
MAVADNLREVREKISRACDLAGRDPDEVTLVAVSKTVPVSLIQEAYNAGHRHFGESRLQEAVPKIDALPKDILWHFIGKLQSNKAKRASQLFSVIHTLESEGQLREIQKSAAVIDGLLEVNIAGEAQKSGISPSEVDAMCKTIAQYPSVRLRGLMSIGPAHQNAELMRPFFRELRELNEKIGGTWLSLGMSNDYEVAIQEGSTHVRVGSAIFGSRS